ncbi:MAG: radical SAM protein [Candidatus Hydrogenedentota bacterium]
MATSKLKYVYGPVPSWRLGSSLGIDPISRKHKICSFDCVYCQLGKTKTCTDQRKEFVAIEQIIKELKSLPPLQIDYITLSGTGEPTLAKNLGRLILKIKNVRPEKIAVLTNASLLSQTAVRQDLLAADLVAVKLDAATQEIFEAVNKPVKRIRLNDIIRGIKDFRNEYTGQLVLQIMFIEHNQHQVKQLAALADEIKPDEAHLNTPLRPCGVRPLSQQDMDVIKRYFKNQQVVMVYDAKVKQIQPISSAETIRRRGKNIAP